MKKKKIILLSVLIILFLINTVLIKIGYTKQLDDMVHLSLSSLYTPFLKKIMHIITFFGCTLWIVILSFIMAVIFFIKNRPKSYIVATLIILSTILNNVIKVIIRRARPLNMLVSESTFSYPSGHMMASTTIYGILVYFILKSKLAKKYKITLSILLILFILLIGFSRIYLRAHFFTDVLGAGICSLSLIVFLDILNDKYKWI